MTAWLPAALLSLFCFGLWGFFSKIALLYLDSKSTLIYQTVGVLVIGIIILSSLHFKPETHSKGIVFGLLTGIAYGIGCLFYLIAADNGKVTTVVTMTALYPLITIILSWLILHESITLKQYSGILLALLSIYLMTN